MVMYYLKSRDLKKIEGRKFALRIQKNSQDSVRFAAKCAERFNVPSIVLAPSTESGMTVGSGNSSSTRLVVVR